MRSKRTATRKYRSSEQFMREAILMASLNAGGSDHTIGAVITCLTDEEEVVIGKGRNGVHRIDNPYRIEKPVRPRRDGGAQRGSTK